MIEVHVETNNPQGLLTPGGFFKHYGIFRNNIAYSSPSASTLIVTIPTSDSAAPSLAT